MKKKHNTIITLSIIHFNIKIFLVNINIFNKCGRRLDAQIKQNEAKKKFLSQDSDSKLNFF